MIEQKVDISDLKTQLDSLQELLGELKKCKTESQKLVVLEQNPSVKKALTDNCEWDKALRNFQVPQQVAVKSILAIGQGEAVFNGLEQNKQYFETLLQVLLELESAYDAIGGIVGYHVAILKLIIEKQNPGVLNNGSVFQKPLGIDIDQDSAAVRLAIRCSIESMGQLAEIYPVGGAGDRLDLHDEITKEPLPAAALPFLGKTLLEGLIRDLQAREYLHYKLIGKQLNAPIAMMTSHEKNNHALILKICEEHGWFGRSRNLFFFFTQPLVPVLTIKGEWVVLAPLQLMLKPGGHGVIWKLAKMNGIFSKFRAAGCNFMLVRQINNPVAGTDYSLCAFVGWGMQKDKSFGFASCPRLLNASEGMDVLVEAKDAQGGYDYYISNIEYTEFEHRGLSDTPEFAGSPYSAFPANTNVLFAKLQTIEQAVNECPIPGMLINTKQSIKRINASGQEEQVAIVRLESTMQNISDKIVDHFPNKLKNVTADKLSSYITYNERRKTIAVTKKAFVPSEHSLETPEGCYYSILQNSEELLSKYCGYSLPALGAFEDYLSKGPPFILQYHPALGPIYSIIGQKIQKGKMKKGSELILEISEIKLKNLELQGSLIIIADTILGKKNREGHIIYGEDTGKCTLINVKVENAGIDKSVHNVFWKNHVTRKEELRIILHGNAEFYAENVTFKGHHYLEVQDGQRMIAYNVNEKVHFKLEPISSPTWFWKYSYDKENRISLT